MLVFIWLFHINRNSIRKRLVAVLVPQKSTKMLSQRTDLSLHAPKPKNKLGHKYFNYFLTGNYITSCIWLIQTSDVVMK